MKLLFFDQLLHKIGCFWLLEKYIIKKRSQVERYIILREIKDYAKFSSS